MILLQLANDTHVKSDFIRTAEEVADYIDIIEVEIGRASCRERV